jgi:hypothetical protein
MNILLVSPSLISAAAPGDAERSVWQLARSLARRKHTVEILARKGSSSPAGRVGTWNPKQPLAAQIPEGVEVVHFHDTAPPADLPLPWLRTVYTQLPEGEAVDSGTVFLSNDHARRHGASTYV